MAKPARDEREVVVVHPAEGPLRGRLTVPPDKSVSHRAVLLAALAAGVSRYANWLVAADTLASLRLVEALGVETSVVVEGPGAATLTVRGAGFAAAPAGPRRWELRQAEETIDCANSGTTMRLGLGIAAALPFATFLTGDASLRRRPMARVLEPLAQMGVRWLARAGAAPLAVQGPIERPLPAGFAVRGAQVKSALLLAGLCAPGETVLRQEVPGRDHTERLLRALGAEVETRGDQLRLAPPVALAPLAATIPGDPSSASFLAAAAALVPGSAVELVGVGLNPTRTGFFRLLGRLGADVEMTPADPVSAGAWDEPCGEVRVRHGKLRGVQVTGEEAAEMIDELPLVAVLGSQAVGATVIRGAAELRVKESDRIRTVVEGLRALGAEVEERPDGLAVSGPQRLRGGEVDSHGDHRIAMALAVAALVAQGTVHVRGAECVAVSYPRFFVDLAAICGGPAFPLISATRPGAPDPRGAA